MSGTLIGVVASISIVLLWLFTFHKRFFTSLVKAQLVTGYGVYTELGEALRTHIWFLLRAKLPGYVEPDRAALEQQVKDTFLKIRSDDNDSDQVLITHSCRSIFYYIIRTLLEEKQQETGEMHIKIAMPSLHFGSFFRLVKGIEKAMGCKVEFYEIDLTADTWELENNVNEKAISSCDLILCQHMFGVPFQQDVLFQLGNKYNIPILEDCVQSGSLFSQYKGNALSDIIMWSGGLDKTPQCFGGGFGYFRDTQHGNHFFQKCQAYHESLPMDTWKARLTGCCNQLLHLIMAKSSFGFNYLIGLVAYVWVSQRGEEIKWYAISLLIRQAKSIAPFQHAESGFLRRPTVHHLQSMMHGLTTKQEDYARVIDDEIRRRDIMLATIPKEYHTRLFPWYTPQVLQRYKENRGICEFSWVVPLEGDRTELCDFLNSHHIITMINTTWEFDDSAKSSTSKEICNKLVYLPNINELTDQQTRYTSSVLAKYCEHVSSHKAE